MELSQLVKLLSLLQAGYNFFELTREIKARKAAGATDADIDLYIDQLFEDEIAALEDQY